MLQIRNIIKKYRKGSESFTALDDVSFDIHKGDFFTITGHSGSGKSTLLHTIGGLIHPDNGTVNYNGKDLYSLQPGQLDKFRKNTIGFIFQQFHLMPYLTVYENIMLACHEKKYSEDIERFLDSCGLTYQENKYPSELSVGEKQRCAFIRAIISEPELLLADEPTGNLDPENSNILMKLINEYNLKGGTVLLVSHDKPASEYRTTSLVLRKGRIVSS